jgi:hypothetical protein
MNKPEVKTDKYGWKFYESLPHGYRLAEMDDFHINGKKKTGMEYLIQRGDQSYFEIHHLGVGTRSAKLKPFLDNNMIFVSNS